MQLHQFLYIFFLYGTLNHKIYCLSVFYGSVPHQKEHSKYFFKLQTSDIYNNVFSTTVFDSLRVQPAVGKYYVQYVHAYLVAHSANL
jgi:hypothetical protein